MTTLYFGFAIADSMFADDCEIVRKSLPADGKLVQAMLDSKLDGSVDDVAICLNPSHQATIVAMNSRYDIHVAIPETAPKVSLSSGDSLIVMGVRGLPRLDATRHEYTQEEIDSATFTFSLYSVK